LRETQQKINDLKIENENLKVELKTERMKNEKLIMD